MNVILDAAVGGATVRPGAFVAAGAGGEWLHVLDAASRLAWFHGPNGHGVPDALAAPGFQFVRDPRAQTGPRPHPQQSDELVQQPVVLGLAVAPMIASTPAASGTLRMQAAHAGAVPANSAHPPMPLGAPVSSPRTCATVMPLPMPLSKAGVATPTGPRSPAAPLPEPPQPYAAQRLLRVHVEEFAEGVVVWLGIDARAQTPSLRAASVAAELRRLLAGSGQRVAAVVCNGQLLEAASTFTPKEP